jgi:glycosyltransferase involved in cell wall biosynthesis
MSRRRTSHRLRIAMIGQKGLPATFGGIEHHVEQLGARLVERGHEVTVFCRSNYGHGRPGCYRGMRLLELPTVGTKHLDAIVHSAFATAAAMRSSFDILHYHAIGPGALAVLPRIASRAKVVLTVHGLDDERAKWGPLAKLLLKTAAWVSAHAPDATIVVSRDLERHYRDVRGRRTRYIPNGVRVQEPDPAGPVLNRFGLQAGRYVLFVGRFVPEKAPDLLLQAFRQVPGDHRLVLVGGSSFTDEYLQQLCRVAAQDPRVVLPGYLFGAELATLYQNAGAFVLPSLLEGLPLTLLEALSHGTPVVASSISPHIEVLGESGPGGRLFAPGNEQHLAQTLVRVLADHEGERRGAASLRERVLRTYNWNDAAKATEQVYRELAADRPAMLARIDPRRSRRRIVVLPETGPPGPASGNEPSAELGDDVPALSPPPAR